MASGFTLLELMVVCALLAFLAGIGSVQLLHWHWRSQYSAEVQQVHAHFERAKSTAQLQHSDTWLGIAEQCLWLASHDQGDCASDAVYNRPSAFSWHPEFASGAKVRFSAGRGMAGFAAGRLVMRDLRFAEHETHLIVSALGRIRVCQTTQLLSQLPRC